MKHITAMSILTIAIGACSPEASQREAAEVMEAASAPEATPERYEAAAFCSGLAWNIVYYLDANEPSPLASSYLDAANINTNAFRETSDIADALGKDVMELTELQKNSRQEAQELLFGLGAGDNPFSLGESTDFSAEAKARYEECSTQYGYEPS